MGNKIFIYTLIILFLSSVVGFTVLKPTFSELKVEKLYAATPDVSLNNQLALGKQKDPKQIHTLLQSNAVIAGDSAMNLAIKVFLPTATANHKEIAISLLLLFITLTSFELIRIKRTAKSE